MGLSLFLLRADWSCIWPFLRRTHRIPLTLDISLHRWSITARSASDVWTSSKCRNWLSYVDSWQYVWNYRVIAGRWYQRGQQGGGTSTKQDILSQILNTLPKEFDLLDIGERAEEVLNGDEAPYVIVIMQECDAMNKPLFEIRRSLEELQKGVDGALNMTDAMEDLSVVLSLRQVPGRNPFHKCSWKRLHGGRKKALCHGMKTWREGSSCEPVLNWKDQRVYGCLVCSTPHPLTQQLCKQLQEPITCPWTTWQSKLMWRIWLIQVRPLTTPGWVFRIWVFHWRSSRVQWGRWVWRLWNQWHKMPRISWGWPH